jgi:hypothetical protein
MVQDDLLPTDDEVAEYHRRGWYISRPIFTEAALDAAIEASERYYAGDFQDHPRARVPDWARPTPGRYRGLRKHDYADLAVPELRSIATNAVLGAIAARLAGVDGVRLWHTQLLFKPPEQRAPGNVGWHTDEHYWLTCSSERMLTAWVPFVDVDEDIGTITMIDRSNTWSDQSDDLSFFTQDLEAQEAALTSGGADLVKVPMVMRRGQVSFHSMRTIHGSGPNRSDRDRRSMAVHLQPLDNRWRWRLRQKGDEYRVAIHANDFVVPRTGEHGVPDYTDPDWFPVVGG